MGCVSIAISADWFEQCEPLEREMHFFLLPFPIGKYVWSSVAFFFCVDLKFQFDFVKFLNLL